MTNYRMSFNPIYHFYGSNEPTYKARMFCIYTFKQPWLDILLGVSDKQINTNISLKICLTFLKVYYVLPGAKKVHFTTTPKFTPISFSFVLLSLFFPFLCLALD